MNEKINNPLIGSTASETFSQVDGMMDLLRFIDYSGTSTGGSLSEAAENALMHCIGLMQDALRFEASRIEGRAGVQQ